jgi:glycerol-1-phosphate dehydrogenase [NAD(P)+]
MSQTSTPVTVPEALRAASETRALEIGSNILNQSPALFGRCFPAREAVIVADMDTFEAAGRAVADSFRQASQPMLEPFIFSDPKLYAEYTFVTQLEEALRQHNAIPIAVGSGTINDLTKLVAHRLGRPYMCIGTAASMDGYTAFGASITHNGSKQTFVCPAPMAVLADLNVIGAAPTPMNAWGYADLLAKVTAGADWILAETFASDPIHPEAWRIIQGGLKEMIADPQGIPSSNPAAIRRLTEGLMLAGFAMQAAQNSRAASGAEHQFSHLWDMQHHTHDGQAPSHGFKVGIGTLAVTALYEQLFAYPIETLDLDAACSAWPSPEERDRAIHQAFPDGDLRMVALTESKAKWIEPAALRAQLKDLQRIWPDLKVRLRRQLLPFPELKSRLLASGAPVEPEQIGISRQRLRKSYREAFFIRRRFTILDVAARTGLLDQFLDRIFSPDGVWPLQRQETVATVK